MFDRRVEVITKRGRPSLALNGHKLIASGSSPLVERIIKEESTLTAGEEGLRPYHRRFAERRKRGGHNIDRGYSFRLSHKCYATLMDTNIRRIVEQMEPLSHSGSKYVHNCHVHSKLSVLVTPKLQK